VVSNECTSKSSKMKAKVSAVVEGLTREILAPVMGRETITP